MARLCLNCISPVHRRSCAEWSMGTSHRVGSAGGDLWEAAFQLPAGTKPALKGSTAEDGCPSQAVASKQPGTMWDGEHGHGRGERACPVPCISSGAGRGSWPGQCSRELRLSAGARGVSEIECLHVCGVSQWGKDGEHAGRKQPLQDTSLLPCCEPLSQHDSRLSWERALQRCHSPHRLLTAFLSSEVPMHMSEVLPSQQWGEPGTTDSSGENGTRDPAAKAG